MALASDIGCDLRVAGLTAGVLFSEDQGRYLIATAHAGAVLSAAYAANVPAGKVGLTGGDALTLNGTRPISLQHLRDTHEGWLPAYADGDA
jgi:phosphoribosylformylglycinamidine synthase